MPSGRIAVAGLVPEALIGVEGVVLCTLGGGRAAVWVGWAV